MTNAQNKINELFHELVPPVGKADTVAGEIIRATSRIGFRFTNDGDHLGIDYGNETCNPAGRYLQRVCNTSIKLTIAYLWGLEDKEEYKYVLNDLFQEVVEFIERHPELTTTKNDIDMLSLLKPEDLYQPEDDEE